MGWEAWARAIHVIGAIVWFGSAFFVITQVMPAVRAAGPSGKGFMVTVLNRGGWGRVFGAVGAVTVAAGLVLYWGLGYHTGPFETVDNALLSVGAILGLTAFGEALGASLPTENRMKKLVSELGKAGPTPEQAVQMEQLALKMGKAGMRVLLLLGLTVFLMVGRTLV